MKTNTLRRYTARAAQIVIILVFMATLVGIVQATAWGVFSMTSMRPRPRRRANSDQIDSQTGRRIAASRKLVTVDGKIHLERSLEPKTTGDARQVELRDSTDTVIWTGPFRDRPYQYMDWVEGQVTYDAPTIARGSRSVGDSFGRALVLPVVDEDRNILEHWRYDPADQVFVGYDTDGRRIGYLGLAGVAANVADAEPMGWMELSRMQCPFGGWTPRVLWRTDRGLYLIDMASKAVELIWDPAGNDPPTTAWATRWKHSADLQRDLLVARHSDKLHQLYLPDQDRQILVETPPDWWGPGVTFDRVGDRVLMHHVGMEQYNRPTGSLDELMAWSRKMETQPRRFANRVYEVGPDGQLALLDEMTWELPRRKARPAKVSTAKKLREVVRSASPPAYHWYAQWHMRWWFRETAGGTRRMSPNTATGILEEVARELASTHPVANWLVGVAFALVAAWHGWSRRVTWAAFIVWLGFVVVFNLPGLLTYLALNHTPVIRCAACGKKRGLGRVDCRACGAPLPAPEPNPCDQALLRPVAAA